MTFEIFVNDLRYTATSFNIELVLQWVFCPLIFSDIDKNKVLMYTISPPEPQIYL